MPPFALAVGITGHRQDAIPGDSLLTLHNRLRAVLSSLSKSAASTYAANKRFYSNIEPRMILISPLADGADQMASEVALQLGYELHALLPFDRDRYRTGFADEDGRARFDALLDRATCVLELPGESSHHLESYVMAGRATVAHSDILVAVWDGLPPRGRGGTGEIVRLAHDRATPTIHIPVNPAHAVSLRWSAFEPAMVTRADDRANVRPVNTQEIGAVLDALLSPPPDERERDFIAVFQSECRRKLRTRIEYPLLLAATGVSRMKRHHWRADIASTETDQEWKTYCQACEEARAISAPLADLQSWYDWADSLAGHFAQCYRSGHVFNFALGALAVLLALATLLFPDAKKGLAIAEFVAVLAILLNTRIGVRQQWHRRWLDYRQLAERLRPMRSLKLLGLGAPDPPGTAANPIAGRWIDWYASAVWRAIGCPSGRIDAERLKAVTATIADREIEPQISYHRSTAGQAHRLDHRLEILGYGLFALTLVGCVVLLIGFWIAPSWVKHNGAWFTVLSAGLPAIGTALFGIRVQGDYVGSAVRSEQTALTLERIAEHLRNESNLSRAGDLMEAAARAMLHDLDEWRLLNQQHDLSVG